jgi:hypothetical protein
MTKDFEEWKKQQLDLFERNSLYFDRKGLPLSLTQYAMLFENMEYRVVKQEALGKYFVSTVWTGLNMSFLKNFRPLIFETMIFLEDENDNGIEELMGYQERYSTEEEALAGHAKAIEFVKQFDVN